MKRSAKLLLVVMGVGLAMMGAWVGLAGQAVYGEHARPDPQRHILRIAETGIFDDAAREYVTRMLSETDLYDQQRATLVLAALVRQDPSQLDIALRLWHTRFEAEKTANEPMALAAEILLFRESRQEPFVARDPRDVPMFEERQIWPELDPRRFVAAMEAASAHIRRVGEQRVLDDDAKRFVTSQLAEPGLAAQHLGALVLERLVQADPTQLDEALRLWRSRARKHETGLEPLALGVELTLYRAWHKASTTRTAAQEAPGQP